MLPAFGILLSERVYLKITFDLIKSETYDYPYFRADDGAVEFTISHGRSNGTVCVMNGITQTITMPTTGTKVKFNKLNSGSYVLTIKEFARKKTYTINANILLNTSTTVLSSYITYKGVPYGTGGEIIISEE